jgi:hypothetical protein
MDFNKTVDLIIRDLEEAREIIDDLKNYPGVPAIQIEMAKAKCRNAAELIALFKDQPPLPKTDPEKEVIVSVPVKKEPVTVSRNQEAGIIADTFENLPDSLNTRLGSLRDDDQIPDYLKTKSLLNLSQSIGINDRFLFIRELFNDNSESFNQALSGIDEAKSLAEAKALIKSYAGEKYETETGKQFLDLVKRKFPGNE